MRLALTFSWVIDKAISHLLMKQICEHMLRGNPYTHFDKDWRLHSHSCHQKDYFILQESVHVHFHLKMRPCVSPLTQQVINLCKCSCFCLCVSQVVPSVLTVLGHGVLK